jgi:predicted transcriptional regulator of viral defense system
MKYDDFIRIFNKNPLISGVQLSPLYRKEPLLRVQLSRWVKSNKLIKLRSNVFLLPERYAKQEVYPLAVAGQLLFPSYVSTYSALQFYGLIPEAVFTFTSVTSRRPNTFSNKLGKFEYLHIQNKLFWGYGTVNHNGQTAYIAEPEKALLDLFYLRRRKTGGEYIKELRLQNTKIISKKKLLKYAQRFNKNYVLKSAQNVIAYLDAVNK